jgi:hypothetical protein
MKKRLRFGYLQWMDNRMNDALSNIGPIIEKYKKIQNKPLE